MSTKQAVKKTVSSPAAPANPIGKAEAPAVTKKVSVKKPTVKKAVVQAPRQSYPKDARVKVKRKNGETAAGRVVECFTKSTGAFIKVNIGTKQVPIVKDYRPVAVKGY